MIYSFLNKWTRADDDVISDFSKGILNRQLLKSYDYSNIEIDIEDLNSKVEKIKKYIDGLGKNSEYYCFIDQPKDRPYEPITNPKSPEEFRAMFRKNIYVISQNDKNSFYEVSTKSEISAALTKRYRVRRIYFPHEAQEYVTKIFKKS